MTRFPGIHGGTTAVVSLNHDETSQNGRISLVDSWKTGHSNDPSIWPALKKMSRERAKVDTLVSCVFGMGEHGGSSMPFGWAGDAAWGATLSTTRRASTYTGSAAAGGRKGVREKSVPAFDGRYPGMPCAVWDTRIAPVRSIHAIVTTGAAGVLLNVTPRYSLFHRRPEEPPGSGFCDAYLGAGMETSPYLVA